MKKHFIFLVKILVPVILLSIIFSRISPRDVIQQIINIHTGYFALSLLVGFGFQIAAGAWRWHYFLKSVYGIEVNYSWVLKHYWIGMFLGYFVPGHLGWDAYRIIAAGRKTGKILTHVTAVFLEKIIGLFSCLFLIMASYPFVADQIVGNEKIKNFVSLVYMLVLAAGFVGAAALFMKKTSSMLIRKLESKIIQMAARFLKSPPVQEEHSVLLEGIKGCLTLRTGAGLWLISIFIRSCSAFGGFLVLRSLYEDTSVMLNFFVIPMMLFISMVPLSFGGLGVREGVFIILYGLFGISSTSSLSASYLGLTGLLLTVSIGGLIMLWDNIRGGKKIE